MVRTTGSSRAGRLESERSRRWRLGGEHRGAKRRGLRQSSGKRVAEGQPVHERAKDGERDAARRRLIAARSHASVAMAGVVAFFRMRRFAARQPEDASPAGERDLHLRPVAHERQHWKQGEQQGQRRPPPSVLPAQQPLHGRSVPRRRGMARQAAQRVRGQRRKLLSRTPVTRSARPRLGGQRRPLRRIRPRAPPRPARAW